MDHVVGIQRRFAFDTDLHSLVGRTDGSSLKIHGYVCNSVTSRSLCFGVW